MITFQNATSVCLFALFVIIVLMRAAMLRKRGIRILVFGQTDKSDFMLVPLVFAIFYTVLAKTFGLPIWDILIHSFWKAELAGWVGLMLCVVAVTGFALTLVSFGTSFRVGIDVNKPDKLVTSGMFSVSRNPIYVCFLLFFSGCS